MMTVVCDASKMKVLLEQCNKCTKLKHIIKIGPAVTDEEKEAGEKVGVKVTSFKELEVSKNQMLTNIFFAFRTVHARWLCEIGLGN